MPIRRIAANFIETVDGTIEQGIVVLQNRIVLDVYSFSMEEAMTEWCTGTIIIRPDFDGQLKAYKDDKLLT